MTDPRARVLERIDKLEALAREAAHADGTNPKDPRLHWGATLGAVTWAPARREPAPIIEGTLTPGAVVWASPDGDLATVAVPASPAKGQHVAAWDPAAVLALCASARELAELHRPDDLFGVHCETCQVAYQCQTIRATARMLGIDPDA